MADTVIKSYVWWLLALLLGTLLCVGAYYVWSRPGKSTPIKSDQSYASDNATGDSSHESADATQALQLLSHQLTPGAILSAPLFKDGVLPASLTVATTGERSLTGKPLSDGLFLHINTHDTKMALDQRDDRSSVLHGIAQVGSLITRSGLFFSVMGDALFEKVYSPLLAAHKAALLFPVVGIRPAIDTTTPVVFFRPSYTQELAALVHYARGVLKKNKVAVFYEESASGHTGCAAVRRLLRDHGMGLCAAASYQPGTVNIGPALEHIVAAEPEVVICISQGRPAYNFIREAVNRRLHAVSFLGVSCLAGIADHLRRSRGISLITASVVPNPYNSQLPIVQEFRRKMQTHKANKGLSTHALEGYINSDLCAYFVKQLAPDATIGDLYHRIMQAPSMDFKGLSLSMQGHTLSHTVWINEGADTNWREYVVKDQ